ncbi:MAG: hypothetical protein HY270_08145 [Deltaproteobacteria bacterium]|nr:hypothetical protein [Deltaproteobacteria bacterium]
MLTLVAQPATYRPYLNDNLLRSDRPIRGKAFVSIGDEPGSEQADHRHRREALAALHRSPIRLNHFRQVGNVQHVDDLVALDEARRVLGQRRVEGVERRAVGAACGSGHGQRRSK